MTLWPSLSIMVTRLEHADITASCALCGREGGLNAGGAALGNRTAMTSASSSTRRGRMDTTRHRKSRWAYSRFSSSIPIRVRSYVSSNVFGKSSNTFRILAGKVRHSLSILHTAQRNLQHHVSVICEAHNEMTYMQSTLTDSVSTTSC